MKPLLPLLPLLVFVIIVGNARADVDPMCRDGKRPRDDNETIVRNAVRTDLCNGYTGKIDIYQCHIPGKNMSIAASSDEIDFTVVDGVMYKYKCESYGHEGISVTYRSIFDFDSKVDATKPAGSCNEGSRMWIPNQQWDEIDYVKRCNPETFLVEIIGCRAHDGTFLPVGSNRTDERFVESLGNVTSIEQCSQTGRRTEFDELIHILPENDFQGCVAKIDGEKVELKVGERKTDKNNKVRYTCTKEHGVYRVKVACLSQETDRRHTNYYLRYVKPGEHTIQDGRELWCKPTADGNAELVRVPLGSEPNCDGRRLNVTWEVEQVVFSCQLDENSRPVEKVVACISSEWYGRNQISVGRTRDPSEFGYNVCDLNANGTASLVYISPTCVNGTRKQDEEWIDKPLVKKCVIQKFMMDAHGVEVIVTGCVVGGNVSIPVGETRIISKRETCTCKRLDNWEIPEDRIKFMPVYNATLTCEKKEDPSTTTTARPPNTCSNGKKLNQTWTEKGVVRQCNSKGQIVAKFCRVTKINKDLQLGQHIRENGVQYKCEKQQSDAKLVVKGLAQLCREGDTSFGAWIADDVLRDCVRSKEKGKKPEVHGRLCLFENGKSVLEVGQTIEQEFEDYSCVREGKNDAVRRIKHAYHSDYIHRNDTCKNGKKVGEEWLEHIYVRRACRARKNEKKPVVVDLGCELPDGKRIHVGAKASWQEPGFARYLHCKKGKPGFGAEAEFYDLEDQVRTCENDKKEGEKWEAYNVLRTCKEVNDKMTIVAIHCVFGNETLEIGQIYLTSDMSSLECKRVGAYDASVSVDVFPPYETYCENGKKIGEEWNDGEARKACRIRDNLVKIVILGCILEDGRILAVGQKDTTKVVRPGYEELQESYCRVDGDQVDLFQISELVEPTADKKNPCGEKEYGDVWAKGSFLKKCKHIEGNMLSAVTIGCVTVKETHMLEGQFLFEDDYDIKCSRNEDDKLEIHYSFTVVEQ